MYRFNFLLDVVTNTEQEYPYKNRMHDLLYLIRRGLVHPKDALQAINAKIMEQKFTTAFSTVVVLEYFVKHGNSLIHDEVCTGRYLQQLRKIVKTTKHMRIRHKILKLIEIWMYNFANDPKYKLLKETQQVLMADGFIFPNTQRFYSIALMKGSVDLEHCQRCTSYCSRPICILPDHPICRTCYEQLNNVSILLQFSIIEEPKSASNFTAASESLPQEGQLQVALSSSERKDRSDPIVCEPAEEWLKEQGHSSNNQQDKGPSGICCVCMENKATHIFVYCGHRCICEGCVRNLRNNTCPVCRCVYTSIIQVFDV